ncbi:MAG: divalent metal cation transporter [Candidatus Taylorbacteria bacterium]|nr:divalent metal cation transporter [Candidatus Taylorbacteria bacterium]
MHIISDKEYEEIQKAVTSLKDAPKKAKKFWHNLGPGLTTGASDDDPSGIATYSQTGAATGFRFTWLALFTFPLMAIVQEMCARIGIVTGQGLAANIRQHYSKTILYTCTILLLGANIFNIGADLGAMAEAVKLLLPISSTGALVVMFGVLSLLLQVFTSYEKYARYLKYLALILLAYVCAVFFVYVDWSLVWKNLFIPSMEFTKEHIILVCAILGTTISPYLFFWQTSQEVEDKILHKEKIVTENVVLEGGVKVSIEKDESVSVKIDMVDPHVPEEIKNMRVDVWVGMFVSNIVMFFIIVLCGAALHTQGITNITTAADAAQALRPFAGDFAYALFAFGIIGTGLLAIPVLAGSAAYAVSESFGWRFGLYRKLKEAYAFYGVIAFATIVGILLNFIGLDPIQALIYSAVANGVVSPIILILIVQMASRNDIMGEYKNSTFSNLFGWITVGLMTASVVGVALSIL